MVAEIALVWLQKNQKQKKQKRIVHGKTSIYMFQSRLRPFSQQLCTLRWEMDLLLFFGQIVGYMGRVLLIWHALRLMVVIPARKRWKRTVHEVLTNHVCVSDIQWDLPVGVLVDFLQLWDILANFQLQPDIDDRHIWHFSATSH